MAETHRLQRKFPGHGSRARQIVETPADQLVFEPRMFGKKNRNAGMQGRAARG